MLKQKKSQGMSINVMIIAAIGLIILVVLITILTGRTANFTKGAESVGSCESSCIALGMAKSALTTRSSCVDAGSISYQVVPGKFDDVTGTDAICCCFK